MRDNLPLGTYNLFQDSPTLLDYFSESHLFIKEFLNKNYHASRDDHFNNSSEARDSASFARKLPSIFGKVDSSSSGVPSSLTQSLHSMKTDELFNSPDTHSGTKQKKR